MSELREDLLTGARVIVAPARSVRPVTFRIDAPAPPRAVASCPFCPGNEHETPPEVTRRGDGAPDTPGWHVRIAPNKFPIVGAGVGVSGAHEVVVFSPRHDCTFADLDDAGAIELFDVFRERISCHLANGHVHAHAFINQGQAAGASIEHPHAQVVALDLVPPFVNAVLDRFAAAGRDLVHDALDEARDAALTVLDDDAVVSWCPPASPVPYAGRCALPFGRQRFDIASDHELHATALAVRDYLRRVRARLGDVAYNVIINTAPADDPRPFHWWIDILPRVAVRGGFEFATDISVCPGAPETAAVELRTAR